MFKTIQLLLVAIFRTILLAIVIASGIFIYREVEDVTIPQSGHLLWTIMTTVGYGNITPKTRNGRIFVIVYSFFAIPVTVCCLLSYSSIVTNTLKFILTLIEKGCCKQRRVESINLKIFFILVFGLLLEIFLWAYGLSELENYSYVDALYAWVNTFFTIGFGDNYPQHKKPESNFTNFGLMIFLHVVTLVTIGSLIQSILAMVDSIDNDRRNICAILLCCYKNEKRDLYAVYNKDEYGMECAV